MTKVATSNERVKRTQDTLGRFFTISTKGNNFCGFPFAFLHAKHEKKVYSIRKEFAPGSKFFPYRVDPF